MPGSKNENWEEIKKKAKETNQRHQAYGEVMDGANVKDQIENFKRNAGSTARLAEKQYYYEAAHSNEFATAIENLSNIKEHEDKTPLTQDEQKMLDDLKASMNEMRLLWMDYTEKYRQVGRAGDGAIGEAKKGMEFAKKLEECKNQAENLMEYEASEVKEFREIYAYIMHMDGHYSEMHNGSLSSKNTPKVSRNPNTISKSGVDEMFAARKQGYDLNTGYWDRRDEVLFPHEPSPDDVMQGGLEDDYLLGAAASIAAQNPAFIRNMMRDNKDGTVTVRLYRNTPLHFDENNHLVSGYVPVEYTVSKSTPYQELVNLNTKESHSHDAFANKALWVQMLEKAVTLSKRDNKTLFGELFEQWQEVIRMPLDQLAGTQDDNRAYQYMNGIQPREEERDYQEIEGGKTNEGLYILTGQEQTQMSTIKPAKENPDELFEKIESSINQKCFMTTSTSSVRPVSEEKQAKYDEQLKELKAQKKINPKIDLDEAEKEMRAELFYGLPTEVDKNGKVHMANHVYSITNAIEENGQKYIVVRNPKGTRDFSGDKPTQGKDNNLISNGYSKIPANEFTKMFNEACIARNTSEVNYTNPTAEVKTLVNKIMDGLEESRSGMNKLRGIKHASPEFRELYKAAQKVSDLINKDHPSVETMKKSLEQLKTQAENYIKAKSSLPNPDSNRSLRLSLSEAAMHLPDIFEQRNTQEGKELLRLTEQQMFTQRVAYALQHTNKQDNITPEKVQSDKKFMSMLDHLKEEQLLKVATCKDIRKVHSMVTKLAKDSKDVRSNAPSVEKVEQKRRAPVTNQNPMQL